MIQYIAQCYHNEVGRAEEWIRFADEQVSVDRYNVEIVHVGRMDTQAVECATVAHVYT